MKSRAFTLIELLVVVLIIGILASIALPQYQAAIDKARYATMMPYVRALYNAQELHRLETGSYSNSFDDLVINYRKVHRWTALTGLFWVLCAWKQTDSMLQGIILTQIKVPLLLMADIFQRLRLNSVQYRLREKLRAYLMGVI